MGMMGGPKSDDGDVQTPNHVFLNERADGCRLAESGVIPTILSGDSGDDVGLQVHGSSVENLKIVLDSISSLLKRFDQRMNQIEAYEFELRGTRRLDLWTVLQPWIFSVSELVDVVEVKIDKAMIFWPEMIAVVSFIVLFLYSAITGLPGRADEVCRSIQNSKQYRDEVETSPGLAHLALNLGFWWMFFDIRIDRVSLQDLEKRVKSMQSQRSV